MNGNQSVMPCIPDTATIRRLAVEADVDPRSILAVLRRRKVRGMAGHRAREVLSRHGHLPQDSSPNV